MKTYAFSPLSFIAVSAFPITVGLLAPANAYALKTSDFRAFLEAPASAVAERPAVTATLTAAKDKKDWWGAVEAQRVFLLNLPANWDGYGAAPIDKDLIRRLLGHLETALGDNDIHSPDIIPGSDGSLQAEWHLGDDAYVYHLSVSGEIYLSSVRVGHDDVELFDQEAFQALGTLAPHLRNLRSDLKLAA